MKSGAKSRSQAALEQGMDILHFARSSGVRPDCAAAGNHNCAKLGDASTAIMLMTQVQESAALAKKRNNRRKKLVKAARVLAVRADALHRL